MLESGTNVGSNSQVEYKPWYYVMPENKQETKEVVSQPSKMFSEAITASTTNASQLLQDAGTFVADNKEAFLGAAAVVGTVTIAKGIFDVVRNPQARTRGIVEIATGATAVLGSAAGFYAIKA